MYEMRGSVLKFLNNTTDKVPGIGIYNSVQKNLHFFRVARQFRTFPATVNVHVFNVNPRIRRDRTFYVNRGDI